MFRVPPVSKVKVKPVVEVTSSEKFKVILIESPSLKEPLPVEDVMEVIAGASISCS